MYCLICKIDNKTLKKLGYFIVKHHINLNHNDNRKENVIYLCPSCHFIIHKQIKRLLNIAVKYNIPKDIAINKINIFLFEKIKPYIKIS